MTDSVNEPNWNLLPEDPESFFGLERPFDLKDLKRSYSRLIKQYKPEKSPAEFQKIRAAYEGIMAQTDKIAFFADIGAIEVEGDRAVTRSFCNEIIKPKAGAAMRMVGGYKDVLVKKDGRWLFAERNYEIHIMEGEVML